MIDVRMSVSVWLVILHDKKKLSSRYKTKNMKKVFRVCKTKILTSCRIQKICSVSVFIQEKTVG